MSKVISIGELGGQPWAIVRLIEKATKAANDQYGNLIKAFEFKDDEIIILSLYKMGRDRMQVDFATRSGRETANLPANFKMTLLEGEERSAVTEKLQPTIFKNLRDYIRYNGSIGCDPEVFCEDEKGEVIPAFNFLGPKSKPNKHVSKDLYYKSNIYWDGFQAEFDTQPYSCMQSHTQSIHAGLNGLHKALKEKFPKGKLSAKTVVDIAADVMKNTAPEHAAFGCMPSLNIYGMEGAKMSGEDVLFRAAGGHIHFGLYDPTKLQPNYHPPQDKLEQIIKSLDAILGVACVSMFAKYDDPRRRIMYGLAGEYRLPPHGLEYRVLSNAWLWHPMIANIVFDLARTALKFGEIGLLKYWQTSESETVETINNCDVKQARAIIGRNERLLKQLIDCRYHSKEKTEFVFGVIVNGMESVLRNPTDIASNWEITNDEKFHYSHQGKDVRTACELKKDIA